MLRRITKKRAIVALSVVSALALAGGAYAYFTASGSGTGHATVGQSANFVVTDTSTPAPLFPGTGSVAIAATIDNNGPANQGLGTATVTINAPTNIGVVRSGDATHVCSASDYTLTAANGSGWKVAQDGGSATYTYLPGNELNHDATVSLPAGLSLSMVDQPYNQDNCQGATVNWTDSAAS